MGRKIDPKHVADWYDPYKLKGYFEYIKGFESYVEPASRILGLSKDQTEKRINRSKFWHEETIAIAKALNMSLEEYESIFLKDVFNEKKDPHE